MSEALVCWKCGASIDALPLPLGRAAECPVCRAELHVCRLCEFYDPRVSQACREPIADQVKEKERANFCGYFQPRPNAYQARDDAAAQGARAELDALFGAGSVGPDAGASNGAGPRSEADGARDRLEDLFKK